MQEAMGKGLYLCNVARLIHKEAIKYGGSYSQEIMPFKEYQMDSLKTAALIFKGLYIKRKVGMNHLRVGKLSNIGGGQEDWFNGLDLLLI